jgi:TonB family protein
MSHLLLSLFLLGFHMLHAGVDSLVVKTERKSPSLILHYQTMKGSEKKNGFYLLLYNGDTLNSGNYRNNEKDGTWVYYYSANTVHVSGRYKEGKKEGEWLCYFSNGILSSRINYIKGERQDYMYQFDGGQKKEKGTLYSRETYYKNGKISESISLKKGKSNGPAKRYYENGALKEERFMKEGRRDSMYKFYYENGKLWEHLYYKEGGEYTVFAYNDSSGNPINCCTLKDGNGIMRFYDKDGYVVEEAAIKNGWREGAYKTFAKRTVISEGAYKHGKMDGVWAYYYSDGKRKKKRTYSDGEITGECTDYYRSGAEWDKGMMIQGVNEGMWTTFYETGKIKSTHNYLKGRYEGFALEYTIKGKPQKSGQYVRGQKTGIWTTVDKKGKETFREDFGPPDPILAGSDTIKTKHDIVFSFSEEMPNFPGGEEMLIKFLQNNIHYPPHSKENGIQGTVVLSFVVNVIGEITDLKILKGVAPDINEESIRVVKQMPRWSPGLMDDEPVNVQYNLPISYTMR